ncbi:ABC transporter substrate-binding protein [Herpetosiphon sp. NSE202]|uniref:ABC transporter substrate-binding protein n=1 Tax=Herpetosiphon sp. NSE202 TaxID=3351349 RepID=UPI0036396CC9
MNYQRLGIGMLLPLAADRSPIDEAFEHGLRSALAASVQTGTIGDLQLYSETVGASAMMLEQKIQQLLSNRHVDVLVLWLQTGLIEYITPFLARMPRPTLVVNLGENIPRTSEQHSWIIQHSLGLWQAHYALGRWAAEHLGHTTIHALSHYDSGYDLHYALVTGFEQAGGEPVGHYLSHVPPDRGNFAPLWNYLAETPSELLFYTACGPEAKQFLAAWSDSPFVGKRQLVVSPMTWLAIEPELRTKLALTTCLPWHPNELPAAHEQPFATLAQLLGTEAGAWLAQALPEATSADDQMVVQALAKVAWSTSRGPIQRYSNQQTSVPKLYLVQTHPTDQTSNQVLELEQAALDLRPLQSSIEQAPRSGWLNSYLCV